MGYIERNLLNGEEIVYKAKNHWWSYFRMILLSIFGLVLTKIGAKDLDVVTYLGWLIVVYGVYKFFHILLLTLTSQYVVTNKRLFLKYGIISRDTSELFLNKMEGLDVKQSVLGRILGYGNVKVSTGGEKTIYPFIKNTTKLRQQINNQIDAVK